MMVQTSGKSVPDIPEVGVISTCSCHWNWLVLITGVRVGMSSHVFDHRICMLVHVPVAKLDVLNEISLTVSIAALGPIQERVRKKSGIFLFIFCDGPTPLCFFPWLLFLLGS